MITVIAPYPTKANQKDGMTQRILSIDKLVESQERRYLEISFRRYLKKSVEQSGRLQIFQLNAFLHFFLIFKIMKSSKLVYIHSAYNALKILPFIPFVTIVFDAHGIVPEELSLSNHRLASLIIFIAEWFVVKRCAILVCVSNSMRLHFENKYGRYSDSDLVYPILPIPIDNNFAKNLIFSAHRLPNSVVYAGGVQIWQNVDKMIQAAVAMPSMHYDFLSGDAEVFERALKLAGAKDFDCKSVDPILVHNFYLKATFGFILREEILVNKVACPTKLIEYIYWGVVPIVITPKIGDFDEDSLQCVYLDDFLVGKIPNFFEIDAMRKANRDFLDSIVISTEIDKSRLVDFLLH